MKTCGYCGKEFTPSDRRNGSRGSKRKPQECCSYSCATRLKYSRNKHPNNNFEWLKEHYLDKKLSTLEMAKLCYVTIDTICEWLKKCGIRTRSFKESGKLMYETGRHKLEIDGLIPFWKKHTLDYPRKSYPWEFHKKKETIKHRDGYMCQYCHRDGMGMDFLIHHIDNNKSNNDLGNLITLCRSCHTKGTIYKILPEDFQNTFFRQWA